MRIEDIKQKPDILMIIEVKPKSPYEYIWLSTRLKYNDELIIGCIYRSPNTEKPNSINLREIMEEAAQVNKSHILILGDFNYPTIDWRQENMLQARNSN